MGNIYLTKEQIKKLKPLSDDSAGFWGTCFSYDGGVLKVFSNLLFENKMKKRIRKNIKRESPIIMYPQNKLYIIDNGPFLAGYKCQKAKGESLKKYVQD